MSIFFGPKSSPDETYSDDFVSCCFIYLGYVWIDRKWWNGIKSDSIVWFYKK